MKLPDDLYPYQVEDYQRILSDEGNFLNFSEMGTGKTPVALAVSQLGDFGKTLIVCPKTLQLEWARQIQEWCGIDPSVARRSCYRRLETLFDGLRGIKESPFFIINYETFRIRRHLDILNLYPFDLIILDEGHKIRNPRTKQTKGIFEFIEQQRRQGTTKVLVLTGSPIVNSPPDLHTLLSLVRPSEFDLRGRMEFINRFCYYTRSRYGIHVWGVRDMESLRKITSPYTIRHTKQEVLPYLPEKYYRIAMLEMEGEQRKIYNQMEKELCILLDSGEPLYAPCVLAALMRLRQLNLEPKIIGVDAPSSKTEFLDELVEEFMETDRKLIVFSCFETYIDYIHRRLKTPHVVITGRVSVPDRMAAVNLFQNDPSIRLALGTVQVMGEGITLTAASDVILMDRWWNPAVNMQAVDRLHRIGQPNAVQIITPVNEDSIDQDLEKILLRKAKLSSTYLGDRQVIREVIEGLKERKKSQ